jgi:RNase P subunit RPR2
MKNLSKTETREKILEFFSNIGEKSPKEVKKIKRLAMRSNLALGELRKKFCKKCLVPYTKPKTRIKNKTKSVTCRECGHVARWKIKN